MIPSASENASANVPNKQDQAHSYKNSAAGVKDLTSAGVTSLDYSQPPDDPTEPTFAVEATLHQAVNSTSNPLTAEQKRSLDYAKQLRNEGHAEMAYVVEASVAEDWINNGGSNGPLTGTDSSYEFKNPSTGQTTEYDLTTLMLGSGNEHAGGDSANKTPKQASVALLMKSGDLSTLDVYSIGEFLVKANLLSSDQSAQLTKWSNYVDQANTSYVKGYGQTMMGSVIVSAVRDLAPDESPLADDLMESLVHADPYAASMMLDSMRMDSVENGSINDPATIKFFNAVESRTQYWQQAFNFLVQELLK